VALAPLREIALFDVLDEIAAQTRDVRSGSSGCDTTP
jgi:hypothetical protein